MTEHDEIVTLNVLSGTNRGCHSSEPEVTNPASGWSIGSFA